MQLPQPRGPMSEELFAALSNGTAVPSATGDFWDEDFQLSLWVLYEQHYRGFEDVDPRREWDPVLLGLRADLEETFESEVRRLTSSLTEHVRQETEDLVEQLTLVTEHEVDGEVSLPTFLQRHATREQYLEFLVQRSIYHLKESDPHAWAVPRLEGAPKVALAELQYDEFGAGDPTALHSRLFAEALEGAGLQSSYGAYIDRASAQTLASNNVMSLFGLHRRLRGACMGHLAAFEMTSSLPCRRYVQGAERLELDERVIRYFDEHIEADAIHEQIAARDICARLVEAEPSLHDDVLLGAAACVELDGRAGSALVSAWSTSPSDHEEVA